MKIIGLTGGIATGKSTVALFLEDKGLPVIDADQLARDAVMPGTSALEQITALFGHGVLNGDGMLDRKHLGAVVFPDPEKRRRLEAILHPEIRKRAEERIAQAAEAGHRYLIYMAPLLIEAGATDRVDTIWVVTVRPEIQLERLMKRESISREQAERIIATQMPLAEKEKFGSVVIDNSGTKEETKTFLEAIFNREIRSSND